MIKFWRINKSYLPHIRNINSTYYDEKMQDVYNEKGIDLALDRKSGWGKNRKTQELVRMFLNYDVPRIIINEYVPYMIFRTKYIREAIKECKKRDPNLYIAVWHNAFISPFMASFYRKYVDLVLFEAYWPWKSRFMLWLFFKLNYLFCRSFKNRILFALGINDNKERRRNSIKSGDYWHIIPWANDEKTQKIQAEYIMKECPGTSGLGFFVQTGSSVEAVKSADKVMGDYKPT
jgi:hypothetical protein